MRAADAQLRAARAWAAPAWEIVAPLSASSPTYQARACSNGALVALKLQPAGPPDVRADVLARLRLRREAWAWAATHASDHDRPYVRLHNGRAGLVLPWLPGAPLSTLTPRATASLQDPSHTIAMWARIRALAEQLHALHQLGIVHRDLHPDNACAPPDTHHHARLIDLGSAYVPGLAPEDAALWQGRPDLSAPERRAHPPAPASPATDRFGFGRMAQALLAPDHHRAPPHIQRWLAALTDPNPARRPPLDTCPLWLPEREDAPRPPALTRPLPAWREAARLLANAQEGCAVALPRLLDVHALLDALFDVALHRAFARGQRGHVRDIIARVQSTPAPTTRSPAIRHTLSLPPVAAPPEQTTADLLRLLQHITLGGLAVTCVVPARDAQALGLDAATGALERVGVRLACLDLDP